MNFIREIIAAFTPSGGSAAAREYESVCETRQFLNDREFFDNFYADTSISFETCTRVRNVLRTQLNMNNVRQGDNVALIFEDVDFCEICFEIGEEFGLKFPTDMVETMDGTVDSIIQTTEHLRSLSPNRSKLAT